MRGRKKERQKTPTAGQMSLSSLTLRLGVRRLEDCVEEGLLQTNTCLARDEAFKTRESVSKCKFELERSMNASAEVKESVR